MLTVAQHTFCSSVMMTWRTNLNGEPSRIPRLRAGCFSGRQFGMMVTALYRLQCGATVTAFTDGFTRVNVYADMFKEGTSQTEMGLIWLSSLIFVCVLQFDSETL